MSMREVWSDVGIFNLVRDATLPTRGGLWWCTEVGPTQCLHRCWIEEGYVFTIGLHRVTLYHSVVLN